MRLGIFAKTFARGELGATLDAVVDHGLDVVQFNMALTTLGETLPRRPVPATTIAAIRAKLVARDLTVAALSGTYNMAHPDREVRADGARRLADLIRVAEALGTTVVTLCTGSRDPADMWAWHPENASAESWTTMFASVIEAVAVAERHGVTLAFEPERNNVVSDAVLGRRLLDEVASPALRVVLDPANLLDAGSLHRQSEVLDQAFQLLAADVVLGHAKDVSADAAIVPAGRGVLDYPRYLSHLAELEHDVPLILHGLDEADVPASATFVRARLPA